MESLLLEEHEYEVQESKLQLHSTPDAGNAHVKAAMPSARGEDRALSA